MRIPRFWAWAEGSDEGPDDRFLYRQVWGWSMSSAADALVAAQERLRSTLDNFRSGAKVGGYYPRVPLREPIVDEVLIDDEQVLVVTRNRYGAEVLSTDRVLIADIDLPDLQEPTTGLLRRLFRRPSEEMSEPPQVLQRLDAVASWAGANAGFGVIAYRTASGLRVFVTGVVDPATSPQGQQILAELGADPIYRELCRSHGTFRARLTPKPWRLPRMRAPRGRWPYPTERAERRFQRWLTSYEAASGDFAVCRKLAAYGFAPTDWEARIIERHDERTKVALSLPLA